MKNTAPISQGIIAVAALFAIIGAGVAFVLYDFSLFASAVIGGVDQVPLIEDHNVDKNHQLTASGQLTITDADTNSTLNAPEGEAHFKTDAASITSGPDTWGHLSINKDGLWTYHVDIQLA